MKQYTLPLIGIGATALACANPIYLTESKKCNGVEGIVLEELYQEPMCGSEEQGTEEPLYVIKVQTTRGDTTTVNLHRSVSTDPSFEAANLQIDVGDTVRYRGRNNRTPYGGIHTVDTDHILVIKEADPFSRQGSISNSPAPVKDEKL